MASPDFNPASGFTTSPWPQIRNTVLAVLEQARPHTCWALLEADVSNTLARLQHCQQSLRLAVSLHAVVLHALARAAAANPGVLTYRHGRKQITFTEADVATTIDRRILGHRIPALHCFRAAHRKSLAQTNWELRAALHQPPSTSDPAVRTRRRVASLPALLRRAFNAWVRHNPHQVRRLYGTIGLTNLQTPHLHSPFWGLPPTVCTVTVAVGSLTRRPNPNPNPGPAAPLHTLCLAGAADHAVVDGMALARFTADFNRLLSSDHGLDDRFIDETRQLAAADPATRGPRPLPPNTPRSS